MDEAFVSAHRWVFIKESEVAIDKETHKTNMPCTVVSLA